MHANAQRRLVADCAQAKALSERVIARTGVGLAQYVDWTTRTEDALRIMAVYVERIEVLQTVHRPWP